MHIPLTALTSTLFIAALGLAQTPAGFTPKVDAKLEIIFGTKAVNTPGASRTKAETAKQPTIGTSDAALNGTYLWMMIDLDVPSNFQNPSAGGRRTNLHALITGFKSSGQTTTITGADSSPVTVHTLSPPSSGAGPVTYVGPGPPPETPPHPHQYVSLLYETAADFTVARNQIGQTLGFNLTEFVAKVKLGTPVRAGFFNVTG